VKLLALRLCEHDSSFCYYDGQQLKYIKTERFKNIKHHAYSNRVNWTEDFENIFNENIENIDEAVIIIDPQRYNLPIDNELFFDAVDYSNYLPLSCKVWRLNHHYAHALSVWMLTQEQPDISIVMDGFGDLDQSWTVFDKNGVVERGFLKRNGSLGIEMAQAGKLLGIRAHNDLDIPGKLMGLQSYGTTCDEFMTFLNKHSIYDVRGLFSFKNWVDFHGDLHVAQLQPLNWIKSLHEKTGAILVNFFKQFVGDGQSVSFTGGVAQNVLWNTTLRKHFKNIIIPPHSTDEGLTLGAIEWLRKKNNLPPFKLDYFPYIQYDEAPAESPSKETIQKAAFLLSQGFSLGWYQGHGEVGPRALGNRSILLDPRIKNGKALINNIKKRENYRPFGATVLYEHKNDYFDIDSDPYMLFTAKVKTDTLQSITHVDGTCRVQTLEANNSNFRLLLEEFYELTGCPVLLNTSMNLAGKPLAGNVKDALTLLETTPLQYLVVGNNIYNK